MKNKFLSSINSAMNALLRLDPESSKRIAKLQGKAVTIELLPLHFIFHCVFTDDGVAIQTGEAVIADTKITGSPLSMLGMMVKKNNRQHFFADDIKIEGSAEIGQEVIALFDELEIDWEEHLSTFIGDTSTYHVGRWVRGFNQWLHKVENSLSANINEFVHEEKEWLPSREALQDFFNDIDQLRMDMDRMDARIHLLRQRLDQDGHKQ